MPISVLMPALSPTMTEGNLVKWHKKPGDVIKAGDLLAEIETDKATMEVEAVDGGKLGKILVAEGSENVLVNTPIAVLLESGETEKDLESFKAAPTPPAQTAKTEPAPVATPAPSANATHQILAPVAVTAPQSSGGGDRVFASPLAKRMAEQKGISLNSIQGSGPHGRIVRSDVENAKGQGAFVKPSAQKPKRDLIQGTQGLDALLPPYEMQKLSNVRKVIAKRLTESKQTVPHFYLTVECEIDALLNARASLNEALEKDQKISVNDFVIKAMACAMDDVPHANAAWGEDHIKIYDRVDVSVAVAIPDGLVTPVIADARNASIYTISSQMKDLAARARLGKLRPEEFQGGTISLSNLGMFGVEQFAAVINPPQGCILAVGAGIRKPIVDGDQVKVATMMACTLSVDHRVVDGALGAQYLKAFKAYIENPIRMFV